MVCVVKQNDDLRKAIKAAGIHQWMVAEKLNISEATLVRWLRKELPKSKKTLILNAVKEIKEELSNSKV